MVPKGFVELASLLARRRMSLRDWCQQRNISTAADLESALKAEKLWVEANWLAENAAFLHPRKVAKLERAVANTEREKSEKRSKHSKQHDASLKEREPESTEPTGQVGSVAPEEN